MEYYINWHGNKWGLTEVVKHGQLHEIPWLSLQWLEQYVTVEIVSVCVCVCLKLSHVLSMSVEDIGALTFFLAFWVES